MRRTAAAVSSLTLLTQATAAGCCRVVDSLRVIASDPDTSRVPLAGRAGRAVGGGDVTRVGVALRPAALRRPKSSCGESCSVPVAPAAAGLRDFARKNAE